MDEYLKFCHELYDITEAEEAWIRAYFQDFEDACEDPGFTYELLDHTSPSDGKYLIRYWCDQYANSDAVAAFTRAFLRTFRPRDHEILSFSHSHDNIYAGDFGGFAVLVTAHTETWFNPESMAQDLADGKVPTPRVYDYADNLQRMEDACASGE